MDTTELELLKQVLPEGYTVVNEGLMESGQHEVAIFNGEGWQHRIDQYSTAREVITKILGTEKEWSLEWGKSSAQHAMMSALGVHDHVNSAVERLRKSLRA